MGSTYLVGGAAAALMLASTAMAQTPAPTPAPAPEATNPAAGPTSPTPPTTSPTTTPPYRGATTTTAPAPTGPRLEAGAKVVNAQNVQVGEVVGVNQATDGSVTVDLRTKAGAVKTLPVAAFGSLQGSVAVRLSETEINAAQNAAPRPAVAATAATPAVPAVPAAPASPAAAKPATPATPATPAPPAEPEEDTTPPDSPN